MLRSNDYKRLAYVRNYPDGFLDQLLVTHMSRWIWVVEITERDSLVGGGGHPEVLAEAVIDTTEHSRDPHLLLWRLPKTIGTWQPDTDGDTVHSISKGASPCTVLSLIEMYDPAAAVGDS